MASEEQNLQAKTEELDSIELSVKAQAKTFGKGKLNLNKDGLTFQTEKGTFKKKKETAISIPINEIEKASENGKELIILWNGITDSFKIKKTDKLTQINQKINSLLEKVKSQVIEEVEETEKDDIPALLENSLNFVDSIFDTLRDLHGKIVWNRIEEHYKTANANADLMAEQKPAKLNLKLKKLFSSIKANLPESSGKEAFKLLKSLKENFDVLAKDETSQLQYPNYDFARDVIEDYFFLNDIILGAFVGDEEILTEAEVFSHKLEELSKYSGFKINVNAYLVLVTRLNRTQEKDNISNEIRALFRNHIQKMLEQTSLLDETIIKQEVAIEETNLDSSV